MPARVFGAGAINQSNFVAAMLLSLMGAVILLAVVNLVRRGAVRWQTWRGNGSERQLSNRSREAPATNTVR